MEFLPILLTIAATFAGAARQRRTTRPRLGASPRYGARPRKRTGGIHENCSSIVVGCCASFVASISYASGTPPDHSRHTDSFEIADRYQHFGIPQRRWIH